MAFKLEIQRQKMLRQVFCVICCAKLKVGQWETNEALDFGII